MRNQVSLRATSLFVVAFLLTAGCQPADRGTTRQAAVDTVAVEAAVDSLRGAFIRAYNAGEAGRIAPLYARDAVLLPANQPPVAGRDSIRAFLARELAAGPGLAVEPHEVKTLSREWASSGGTYRVTVTPKSAQDTVTVRGSYLILFRNTAEGWKLYRHANTYDSLPPSGLPAGR